MEFFRKYGTGTGADIYIPIIKRGVVDYAVGADWTPASGDVKLSIDGGAAANIGTLPTAVAMGNTAYWKFVLADAELQGKKIIVTVADSATKAVEDQAFAIITFGHASAYFVADLSLANLPANVIQIGSDTQSATDLKDFADAGYDPSTNKVQGLVLADAVTTVNGLAANVITAASAASDFGAEIQALITGGAYALSTDANGRIRIVDGTGTGEISTNAGAIALVDTVATLTNAPSDSSGVTTLLSRVTSTRAGYWDNLNIGGAVASQADVQAVNQSASKHLLITTVGQYERPESGSTTYTVEVRTFSALTGAAVNADSTPTVSPVGATSGSLSANLGAGSNPATGVYRYTYTVASNATQEQIRFDVSATISTSTFTLSCYTQVVDLVSATWTSADATKLTAIYDKLPTNTIADETLVLAAIANVQTDTTAIKAKTNSLTFTVAGMVDSNVIDWKGATAPAMTGDAFARLGAPAGVSVSADIAAAKADTAAILDDTGTAGVVVASGSKTGYALSSTGLNLVIPADPGTTEPTFAGNSTIVQWIAYFGAWSVNPVLSDSNSVNLRNTANNADLAAHTISDDGTTFTNGAAG